MNPASKECRGTGACEALLFGKPTCLPTRPCATHLNLRLFKVYVLPLQAETFRDAKPGCRSEQCQCSLRLLQMHEDIEGLFGRENHGLIAAGRLATNESHRVSFLSSGNQPVALPVLKDKT